MASRTACTPVAQTLHPVGTRWVVEHRDLSTVPAHQRKMSGRAAERRRRSRSTRVGRRTRGDARRPTSRGQAGASHPQDVSRRRRGQPGDEVGLEVAAFIFPGASRQPDREPHQATLAGARRRVGPAAVGRTATRLGRLSHHQPDRTTKPATENAGPTRPDLATLSGGGRCRSGSRYGRRDTRGAARRRESEGKPCRYVGRRCSWTTSQPPSCCRASTMVSVRAQFLRPRSCAAGVTD
jgi:hypothetical protein